MTESTANPSILHGLMSQIISESQQVTGDQEIDGTAMTASAAVEHYLSKPLDSLSPDTNSRTDTTFQFWKFYGKNGDKTQKCLADLARKYLTLPPTSTGMCKIFVWCRSLLKAMSSLRLAWFNDIHLSKFSRYVETHWYHHWA